MGYVNTKYIVWVKINLKCFFFQTGGDANKMCSSLLDKLTSLRDECRLYRWSPRNGIEFTIVMNIFSSGERTIKRIIEALNLLSLVDRWDIYYVISVIWRNNFRSRADQCLAVAKEIIGLQGGLNGDTESIYLIDLQRALAKILSKDAAKLVQDTVDNASKHFGTTATRIRYAPVNLDDIDGTFNETEFSSSLMIHPPVQQPNPPLTDAQVGQPRASSSTARTENMENDWQRLESDTDFYDRLRNWN